MFKCMSFSMIDVGEGVTNYQQLYYVVCTAFLTKEVHELANTRESHVFELLYSHWFSILDNNNYLPTTIV